MGGATWTGGLTYLANLFRALRTLENESPGVILVIPPDSREADYSHLLPYTDDVLLEPGSSHHVIRAFQSRFVTHILRHEHPLSGFLRAHGVDCLFDSYIGLHFEIPLLGWIPDFQHVHLPAMFTAQQRDYRNTMYRRLAESCVLLILSSEDARRDFAALSPSQAHKARVVRFVAHVPDGVYDANPVAIVHKYGLSEKFVYLPNQFWKHKNHLAVFEALHLLKQRGIRPFVVCTGNPSDVRHPTYFSELLDRMAFLDIQDQAALLGMVPHEEVYLLIRQAVCVLNPSLYEGWSTTVEEAKSIGKRVLLSDLAVHREQAPPAATYFNPHDPGDLADRLEQIWRECGAGPDTNLEARARRELPLRSQQFAQTFVSVVHEALSLAWAQT